MTSRPALRKGRGLARLAAIAALALGMPLAVAGTANAAPDSVWDRLAKCESGGNWGINTGNGYYGGLQFSSSTWRAMGGSGMPHQASRVEQIRVAERTLDAQGWGAWPACSRKLGLRG
jgi:resuscitation-promoting factor RpfA